jgi:uncharacterized protein with LGFP repeats
MIMTINERTNMSQEKSPSEPKIKSVTEIEQKYNSLGGPSGYLGPAKGDEMPTPDGSGRYRHFQNGSIHWHLATGAHETHGGIQRKWAELGWEQGFCGFPITDELSIPDSAINSSGDLMKSHLQPIAGSVHQARNPQTRCSCFQHGAIVWRITDPQRVDVFDDYGEYYRRRLTQEEFKCMLENTLQGKCLEFLKGKPHDKQFLTYTDIQVLAGITRNVFLKRLGKVPADIDIQCHAAEAVLAPDLATRIEHVKAMVGVAGGAVGLYAILTGLAGIFGWGTGVVAAIHAFFVGTAVAGPIGWIVGGITIASVAAYFALTSNATDKSDKAFRALKGVVQSVDKIWSQYGGVLSKNAH